MIDAGQPWISSHTDFDLCMHAWITHPGILANSMIDLSRLEGFTREAFKAHLHAHLQTHNSLFAPIKDVFP